MIQPPRGRAGQHERLEPGVHEPSPATGRLACISSTASSTTTAGSSDLHVVTGAPGAGKSTLLHHLQAFPLVAVDFDELLDPDGSLLGVRVASPMASPAWPAYNRLWVKIVSMVLRAGRPVLVLCPLTPDEWVSAAADAAGLSQVSWARLDCDDADRRARLTARGWEPAEIEAAIRDAGELRLAVDREFTTTGRSAVDTAAAVAGWVGSSAPPNSA